MPSRDGKRAYDRRSGTGRGKEIKKGGGGSRNWGSDKDTARAAASAKNNSQRVTKGDEKNTDDSKPEEQSNVEEEATPEKEPDLEPEDVTLSYDEYMKQKQNVSLEGVAFKSLSVKGMDESSNAFLNVQANVKQETDFLVMGGGKQPRKKGTKKSEKETIASNFKVGDSKSGGRDNRDGRDGRRNNGRGRRDGGRGKGDRSNGMSQQRTAEINVADPNMFPSL